MTSEFDMQSIDKRARTAGYQDGLLELFAAAVLLSIALMWLVNPAFVGIVSALIAIFGWRLVERVKEKVTYPRIGYFQERPEAPDTTARGMLGFFAISFAVMVLAVVVSGGLTDAANWRRAAPILSGMSLAGGFWYAGDRSGFIRHRVVAVYAVVTGGLLWWFGSGESYETIVWHLLGLTVLLAGLGTWGLLRFLDTNPVRDGGSDG